MAHSRVAIGLTGIAAMCIASCGKDAPHGADTTRTQPPATDSAMVTGVWPSELGAVLVVPSDTESLAVVLYPVGTGVRTVANAGVALVSSSGEIVRRRVGLAAEDSLHCGDAPLTRLSRATPLTWAIGFESAATPLRADSMDVLSEADSTAYSAEMARLASSIGAQQATRFTGLPFTVATMRRVVFARREVVVAQVVRRLNQEADPLEERSLVVAERASVEKGRFTMVHSARADGPEESADHFDMLAALHTSRGVLVIIAREKDSGTAIDILERDPSGTWTVKWSRSVAC